MQHSIQTPSNLTFGTAGLTSPLYSGLYGDSDASSPGMSPFAMLLGSLQGHGAGLGQPGELGHGLFTPLQTDTGLTVGELPSGDGAITTVEDLLFGKLETKDFDFSDIKKTLQSLQDEHDIEWGKDDPTHFLALINHQGQALADQDLDLGDLLSKIENGDLDSSFFSDNQAFTAEDWAAHLNSQLDKLYQHAEQLGLSEDQVFRLSEKITSFDFTAPGLETSDELATLAYLKKLLSHQDETALHLIEEDAGLDSVTGESDALDTQTDTPFPKVSFRDETGRNQKDNAQQHVSATDGDQIPLNASTTELQKGNESQQAMRQENSAALAALQDKRQQKAAHSDRLTDQQDALNTQSDAAIITKTTAADTQQQHLQNTKQAFQTQLAAKELNPHAMSASAFENDDSIQTDVKFDLSQITNNNQTTAKTNATDAGMAAKQINVPQHSSFLQMMHRMGVGSQVAGTVAFGMHRAVNQGRDIFSMQLDPAELGRVDVRLEVNGDAPVRAVVLADNPKSLDMLQRDARLLEKALNHAGLQTDMNSLNFGLRQQNQGQSGQQENGKTYQYTVNSMGDGEAEIPSVSQAEAIAITKRGLMIGRLNMQV